MNLEKLAEVLMEDNPEHVEVRVYGKENNRVVLNTIKMDFNKSGDYHWSLNTKVIMTED